MPTTVIEDQFPFLRFGKNVSDDSLNKLVGGRHRGENRRKQSAHQHFHYFGTSETF